MFKLGTTNFRKFENLNPLEIKPITFLVGRNNSGKSSFVKAILLVQNYLNSNSLAKFSFINNILNDTNIISFGRAKNKSIIDSNTISFDVVLDEFNIKILLTGNNDDTSADVIGITITDNKRGFIFEIDFTLFYGAIYLSSFQLVQNDSSDENYFQLSIENDIKTLEDKILNWTGNKFAKEHIEDIDKLNQLKNKIIIHKNNIQSNQNYDETNNNSFKLFSRTEITISNIYNKKIDELIDPMKDDVEFSYESVMKIDETTVDPDDDMTLFYLSFKDAYDTRELWAKSFRIFSNKLNAKHFHFIGATSMKQNSLLSIKDTTNPLAMAVHDYYQWNLKEQFEIHSFVLKWLRELEIGDDFSIEFLKGEAYNVDIKSDNISVSLNDKGMGSVQAFIIILRIAFCCFQSNYNDIKTSIILEEPELNLHPALQSKIADLLLDAYEKFKIEFIIETHSEYLIRRSQVIVAENELEVAPNENPFCVHYFPKENNESPYQLNYQADGTFDRNFGTGFFDAASLDTLKLVRIKREKKA